MQIVTQNTISTLKINESEFPGPPPACTEGMSPMYLESCDETCPSLNDEHLVSSGYVPMCVTVPHQHNYQVNIKEFLC